MRLQEFRKQTACNRCFGNWFQGLWLCMPSLNKMRLWILKLLRSWSTQTVWSCTARKSKSFLRKEWTKLQKQCSASIPESVLVFSRNGCEAIGFRDRFALLNLKRSAIMYSRTCLLQLRYWPESCFRWGCRQRCVASRSSKRRWANNGVWVGRRRH